MSRSEDLARARAHLAAAQRLLRDAFALRALAAVNRAVRALDATIAAGRPVQPVLALEAPDDPPAPF